MIQIDKSILISSIERSLINFYNSQLKKDNISFYDYVNSLNIPMDDFLADIPESRRFYKKARTKTKINWYKNALRDLELRKKSSAVVKKYNSLAKLSSSTLTWKQYCIDSKEQLEKWRNASNCLLTDFPFIDYNNDRAKEAAFTKEVILNIIDLLEKGFGIISNSSNNYKGVFLQPLEFLLGPIVSVYSPGVQLTNPDDKIPEVIYDDYHVPNTLEYGELVIRSIMDTSDILEHETNLRSLSAFDVSVFNYIVNYVCENDYATFLSTRKFQNYLSNIVRAMFPNDPNPSGRQFARVRSSLAKLRALHIKGINNKDVVRSIDFFDSYDLYTEEKTGQLVVTISVGSYMYDRIATNKTQLVYKSEVARINDKSAQIVYFVFENERQKAYASNRISTELEYSYTFFTHTMRFSSRNTIKKNMDLIDEIFNSFLEMGLLLNSYTRLSSGFLIKFKPFTRDDIVKLRLSEPSLLPYI